MDIADWTATVVVAWVTLSVLVALIVGRVAKFRDQQVPAVRPGKTAGRALGKRTAVWRSTVAADGRVHHRQVA
jgi:membrane protein implicated in regulation of membrane protease activity